MTEIKGYAVCDICGLTTADMHFLCYHRNVAERCGKKKHFLSVENYYVYESNDESYRMVRLQGPLEFGFACWLAKNKIKWRRPDPLEYTVQSKKKKYTPDFVIDEPFQLYVETKGNYSQKDITKMSSVLSTHDVKCILLRHYDFDRLNELTNLYDIYEAFKITKDNVVR